MRTIKFRGVDVENNEYVYGNLVYDAEDKPFIVKYKSKHDFDFAHVKPDSVAQYTNCLDANGEEIYDGDWVKLGDSYGRTYKPTKVFWAYDMACWAVRWENDLLEGLGSACEYVQKLYLVKKYDEGGGKS